MANKPLRDLATCDLVTRDHKLLACAGKTFSPLETEAINNVLRRLPVVQSLLKSRESCMARGISSICTWQNPNIQFCGENQTVGKMEKETSSNFFCCVLDFCRPLGGSETWFWEGQPQSNLMLLESTNHGNIIWKRQAKVPKSHLGQDQSQL